jgi:hypothetical protein
MQEADMTIGGSVNVTGDDGENADITCYESRLSIAGDFVVNGGLYNGGGGKGFPVREEQSAQKRGFFGGSADGSSVNFYGSSIEACPLSRLCRFARR